MKKEPIKQKPETKKSLVAKLKVLALDDAREKSVICSLIGHSRIVNTCFGQVTCARCGDIVGDTLAGCYSTRYDVIVGHNCPECRANFAKLDWKDKFKAPDPFKEE